MWIMVVQADCFGLLALRAHDGVRPRHRAILKAPQKWPRGSLSTLKGPEGRKIQTGAPSSVGPDPLVAGPGLAGCDSSAHDVPGLGSGCPTAGPGCGPSTRYDAGRTLLGDFRRDQLSFMGDQAVISQDGALRRMPHK